MQNLKPQRAVESDGSWHFVGAECDRANPLDHGQNSPVSFPRAVATGPKLATGGGRSTHRAGASGFAISAGRLPSFQISANYLALEIPQAHTQTITAPPPRHYR